jgi:hypothetical protein
MEASNRGPLFRENQNQIDGKGVREGGREGEGWERTIEMIPSEQIMGLSAYHS